MSLPQIDSSALQILHRPKVICHRFPSRGAGCHCPESCEVRRSNLSHVLVDNPLGVLLTIWLGHRSLNLCFEKTLFIKLKSYVIVIVVFDSAHADDFFDIDGNFFHQIQFHGGEVIHDKVGSLPSLSGLPLPPFQGCGVFNVSDLGFDRSKASIGSSVDLNKMVKIDNRLLSYGLYLEQLTDSGDSVRVGRGQGISMVGKS